ncbi:MAG TPA: LysM peptidoglycan-binding domain-containing protein [Candidatus Limnocylindria bacterium]|jgi:LysM repeat protein
MDRICPFLALAADHRTVVDGYDPDHRCHALAEPDELDRARQLQLCLNEAHRDCERYLAAVQVRRADGPIQPVPAPDARVARTRLVLDTSGSNRRLDSDLTLMGPRARRLVLAGVAAVLGILVLVSGVADGLVGLVVRPSPSPTPSAEATGLPTPSTAGASATPAVTPAPTPLPETPAPTPLPPVSQAAAQSYVVREGDTLSAIAGRFGTTVAAIQAANGLGESDVINIGQVLVIPEPGA